MLEEIEIYLQKVEANLSDNSKTRLQLIEALNN